MAMEVTTLVSDTVSIPFMPMTIQALPCPPPILEQDFANCRIPGGVDLWSRGGFYSPGRCFVGYRAECTQTSPPNMAWPIRRDETVVRCIPTGFDCIENDGNPKYATTEYDGTTLSAPAFEIRWRSQDLTSNTKDLPAPDTSQWSNEATSRNLETSTPSAVPDGYASSNPSSTGGNPAFSPDQHEISTSKLSIDPGSIAGIAVGAALGAMGATLAMAYYFIRRRKHGQNAARLSGIPGSRPGTRRSTGPAVIPGQPPVEMDPEPIGPRELDSSTILPTSPMFSFRPDMSHISINELPVELAAISSRPEGENDDAR